MYKTIFILALCAVFSFTVGFTNLSEEKDIKDISNEYVEAFNNHDIEKMMSLWASEVVYTDFNTGETILNLENLTEYFKKQFTETKDGRFQMTLNSIEFVQPNIATAKGSVQYSYPAEDEEKGVFKAEFIKDNNTWKLDTFSQFIPPVPHSNFEHLKDLEWFIGDWLDQDEDVSTHLSFKWDKSKNYIIQNFNMKVLGEEFLDGRQVITWDPAKKKIRSFMFNSNGGLGESTWFKEGDRWYTNTVFVLNDGRKGSAMHIYTKVDNNTYIFSSESRDIDGVIQPNIGPFTVVRKGEESL